MYSIDRWFPKSIFVADNTANHIIEKLQKDSITFLSNCETKRYDDFYVDSTHTLKNTNQLISIESFKLLKEILDINANTFKNELGITDEIKLQNAWLNKSNKGDYNFPHTHSGCLFSGVFYIKSNRENKILFYNDDYIIGNNWVSENQNELSYTMCSYPCVEGRLMIWKSNFLHGNPIQKNQEDKIIISFNYVISH